MRDETVDGFLRQLAARTSAPGGGATAALHAAQAAALIVMAARFSDGPRYDAAIVRRVIPAAEALIDEALAPAEADAAAFGKVTQEVAAELTASVASAEEIIIRADHLAAEVRAVLAP
jgi:formiminotetrahydrofolate cyclodeaminase